MRDTKRASGQHPVEHIMGTAISIDVRDSGIDAGAIESVFDWFRWVDETFSTHKESSQISRLRRHEIELADCSPEVAVVLDLCNSVRQATGGFFDAWASGLLDPSGLVKGWSVERGSEMLERAGSRNHCINAGGDVRVRGDASGGRAWHVGVVHPFDQNALTIVVEGSDLAVATSGVAERGEHVFDPHTGRPVAELASVTVVGPELTLTDAYATAAMAMGMSATSWLPTLRDHEAYVVDASGHAWWTAGMTSYASALKK